MVFDNKISKNFEDEIRIRAIRFINRPNDEGFDNLEKTILEMKWLLMKKASMIRLPLSRPVRISLKMI